jgi:hypothetical protein
MARSPTPAAAKDLDLPRLCDAYRAARRGQEHAVAFRRKVAARLAGDQWSEETADVPRPVNFLSLYCRVVPRSVVPREPRVDLSCHDPKHTATVSAMERWVNAEVKRMYLGEVARRVFLDALISQGVMKVALAGPDDSALSGWNLPSGAPFAKRVSPDNFCWEHEARDVREAGWYAHTSRVPLNTVKDSTIYNAAARKRAVAQPLSRTAGFGTETAASLGRSNSGEGDEAFDYVTIVEFYLPRERLLVTMLADDSGCVYADKLTGPDAPLLVREWVGPDCGPYHFLTLGVVPDNAAGKGPIQDVVTLDEHFNGVVDKLIEQAARQKEVLAAGGAADKDAERIIAAADGQVVRVDNVDKLKPLGFGGPNPNNQQFALGLWDLLNKFSGNLEAMAGLGAQASTATQERIINANSSATVTDMQEAMVSHLSSVVDALCWYWHHHPEKVMHNSWSPPSMPEKKHPTPVYPAGKAPQGQRERNFAYSELDVRVDPYSLQHQTPSTKLAFITQILTQVWTPLAQLFQQAGVTLDANELVDIFSKFGGVPELSQILKHQQPPQAEGGPGSGGATEESHNGPRMPVTSERTYNRVNSSEKTDAGQRTAMQQMLSRPGAGASPNGSTYNPTGGAA